MKNQTNRRVYERLGSSDLADLEIYNKDGSFAYHTMGLVRNVSEGGFSLEPHVALDRADIVVTALDLDGEIVETAGRAVHVSPCGENHYCIGLEFLGNA